MEKGEATAASAATADILTLMMLPELCRVQAPPALLGFAMHPQFSSMRVGARGVREMRRESFSRKALDAAEQQLAEADVGAR